MTNSKTFNDTFNELQMIKETLYSDWSERVASAKLEAGKKPLSLYFDERLNVLELNRIINCCDNLQKKPNYNYKRIECIIKYIPMFNTKVYGNPLWPKYESYCYQTERASILRHALKLERPDSSYLYELLIMWDVLNLAEKETYLIQAMKDYCLFLFLLLYSVTKPYEGKGGNPLMRTFVNSRI